MIQWWVEDCDNWCKTTFKYVFTLKHRGSKLKIIVDRSLSSIIMGVTGFDNFVK